MRYNSPVMLEEFIKWEKAFAKTVPYLEPPSGLYFGFTEASGGYMCTPVDSYTFARTGADGEHFALLTDFGLHKDLEHAPVIRVFPMNLDATQNVRIVAKNIRDFLWLLLYHEPLLMNDYDSEEKYLAFRKKEELEDHSTDYFNHKLWLEQRELVKQAAQQTFQFLEIPNPYQYIKELREEREHQVVLKTKDTLGIIPVSNHNVVPPHPWAQEKELPYKLLDELELFFNSAPLETKLAFIRDYQAEYIQDTNSLLLICKDLERNGFTRESNMLRACMDI